jgi:hypothetical protein
LTWPEDRRDTEETKLFGSVHAPDAKAFVADGDDLKNGIFCSEVIFDGTYHYFLKL